MELSLIHPFTLLVTRMEAGNGWRPTPAVTSSHFSQINGQRTLVNRWSVKSMSGQTLLCCSILALEVPPQTTEVTIEQAQGPSLAINCPAAYHGLKSIICCREVQLNESPNCLSVSIKLLVLEHLIPHATLNDMTRTPVPEAKVQQCRKDPWNTRRRVCQPS